jgi:AraC-like DNA-binding protein
MDLIGFFYGFGVFHGVILAGILLYSPKGNRVANAFMAALVICIALRFLNNWLVRTGYFMEHPGWGLASVPLDFAWGPLLYLYARCISGRPLNAWQVLHFLPSLLMLSAPITFALYPREDQLQFLTYFWSDRTDLGLGRFVLESAPTFWRQWVDMHLHGSFFTLQFGTYCFLVLRQIYKHNQNLEQHYSFTDEMNLRWLNTLTYLCVFFLLLFLVFNRAQLVVFGQFAYTAVTPNTPFLFMVLAIYIIGIMALMQPRIEQRQRGLAEAAVEAETEDPGADDDTLPDKESVSPKYARSGISLEDAQRYKIQLMETMQEKELYLNCDLTLGDLAEEAGMTYHQASQVINNQMNQKFFSFVNNYRIQRAREMLTNPATCNMPIVELALEVGFKSKSSFYNAFKKVTNLTPTQFRKSLED